MQSSLPKTPLAGSVQEQWVRCGKANCHCSRGELHGPYFYHFTRQGGRQVKRYLKRSEAESVGLLCIMRRRQRREERRRVALYKRLSTTQRAVFQALEEQWQRKSSTAN